MENKNIADEIQTMIQDFKTKINNANNENSKHEITRLIDDYKKQDKKELLADGDYEAANQEISPDLFIMEKGKLYKV